MVVQDIARPELTVRVVTAPIAAAGLIGGFAVAVSTGSRPAGGVVLALCGLVCIAIWVRRDGRRTAAGLTAAGLVAFALSHVLGAVIGAWPAVLVVAAATGGLCWYVSDAHRSAESSPRARSDTSGVGSAAEPRGR
jgi:hypothetical protein